MRVSSSELKTQAYHLMLGEVIPFWEPTYFRWALHDSFVFGHEWPDLPLHEFCY